MPHVTHCGDTQADQSRPSRTDLDALADLLAIAHFGIHLRGNRPVAPPPTLCVPTDRNRRLGSRRVCVRFAGQTKIASVVADKGTWFRMRGTQQSLGLPGLTDIWDQWAVARRRTFIIQGTGSSGKPGRSCRSFTPEFKAQIVEFRRGDQPIGQVAKDFDPDETAVRD